eukprot:9740136-Alexandrium_andersonii.AAC.1
MSAPFASAAELAVAGWGSRVGTHFTSAALRAIARPGATPSVVPCAAGRLPPASGAGWTPGRLLKA